MTTTGRTLPCATVLAMPVVRTRAVALPDWCGGDANCPSVAILAHEKGVLHE